MQDLLIRRAVASEQKELESLQLRASLTNAGDRDALLANPDAIELPLAQITAGAVFVAEWNGSIVGFAAVEPRETERANSMHCSSTQTCDVAGLRDRWLNTALRLPEHENLLPFV